MTARALTVLLALHAALALILAVGALSPAPRLAPGAESPFPCDRGGGAWIERAGEGLACVSADVAARAGVRGGDRVTPEGAVARMSPARIALVRAPIDANRASPEELASLPGVGPSLASALVAGRPYRSVEAIARVHGVGARRLAVLRARLYVDEDGR